MSTALDEVQHTFISALYAAVEFVHPTTSFPGLASLAATICSGLYIYIMEHTVTRSGIRAILSGLKILAVLV